MKGVHEDEVGSTYWYAVYRRGHIVRRGDEWGVVVHNKGSKWHSLPIIDWWRDGEWTGPGTCRDSNISAPFVHTYEGIPDEVVAMATAMKLTEFYVT